MNFKHYGLGVFRYGSYAIAGGILTILFNLNITGTARFGKYLPVFLLQSFLTGFIIVFLSLILVDVIRLTIKPNKEDE